jgi:hypothetical protein
MDINNFWICNPQNPMFLKEEKCIEEQNPLNKIYPPSRLGLLIKQIAKS